MNNYLDKEKRIKYLEQENTRLNFLLSIHREKISFLLKLTESVNKNYSASAIIGLFEQNLKELMKVKHYAFFVKTNEWKLMLNKGTKVSLDEIEFTKDICSITKTQSTNSLLSNKLREFEYVIPVLHKNEHLAYFFFKDIEIGDIDCSESEKVRFIETLLNLTIISLENKKLFRKIKTDINTEDLFLAAEVQEKLIPSIFPSNKHFEFFGKYIPFEVIGGDYYDIINIDNENTLFCICDVAGKGVSAGMLMSNFQATLRNLVSRDNDLEELVIKLNEKMLGITKANRYITMFIGSYNNKSRKLKYINAGHNYPILKNGDDLIPLSEGCLILGMFKNFGDIEVGEKTLEKDAILVMYTDGLSEIKNENQEDFGTENLGKYIQKNHQMALKKFAENLIDEVETYKGNNEVFDDISLLCARFF